MRRMLGPAGRVGELTVAAYLCLQRSGIPAGVPIVVRRAGFPQQPQSSRKGDSRHGTDMPVKSLIVANGRQRWHHLSGWTAKQHIGCGIRQTHNQCPNVWGEHFRCHQKNRQGAQRAKTTEPQHGREAANAGSDSMPKNGCISRHANKAQVMIWLVVLTLIRLS